jgi:hypothetical protein
VQTPKVGIEGERVWWVILVSEVEGKQGFWKRIGMGILGVEAGDLGVEDLELKLV